MKENLWVILAVLCLLVWAIALGAIVANAAGGACKLCGGMKGKEMKENLRVLLIGLEMLIGFAACMTVPYYFWQSVMIGAIDLITLWITAKDYYIE